MPYALCFSSSPLACDIMNMDQFTRVDFTDRFPDPLPVFDHRPALTNFLERNLMTKRDLFSGYNRLLFCQLEKSPRSERRPCSRHIILRVTKNKIFYNF